MVMGPRLAAGALALRLRHTLRVRIDVVTAWLAFLRRNHPSYASLAEAIVVQPTYEADLMQLVTETAKSQDDAVLVQLDRVATGNYTDTPTDHAAPLPSASTASTPTASASVTPIATNTAPVPTTSQPPNATRPSSFLPPTQSDDAQESFEYVLMAPDDAQTIRQQTAASVDLVAAINQLQEGNTDAEGVRSDDHETIRSFQSATLPNEVIDNRSIIYGAFPWLFPYANGIGDIAVSKGLLTVTETRRLMLFYDGRFRRCKEFIFLLFNQAQRAAVNRSISIRTKSSAVEDMSGFTALTSAEDFSERLKDAAENPTSPDAKALLKILEEHTTAVCKSVPWSDAERKSCSSQLWSNLLYFGPPSFFMTINPSDIDSHLLWRLYKWGSQEPGASASLPAVNVRKAMVNDDPVAAAFSFGALIDDLLTIFHGIEMRNQNRKNLPHPEERPLLPLGRTLAFYGVTEAQGRGSLHFHYLLWTEELSLDIHNIFGSQPHYLDMMARYCSRIDSQITSFVPRPPLHEAVAPPEDPTESIDADVLAQIVADAPTSTQEVHLPGFGFDVSCADNEVQNEDAQWPFMGQDSPTTSQSPLRDDEMDERTLMNDTAAMDVDVAEDSLSLSQIIQTSQDSLSAAKIASMDEDSRPPTPISSTNEDSLPATQLTPPADEYSLPATQTTPSGPEVADRAAPTAAGHAFPSSPPGAPRRPPRAAEEDPTHVLPSYDDMERMRDHFAAGRPTPLLGTPEALHSLYVLVNYLQLHCHADTCHKGAKGAICCRMGYPIRLSIRTEVIRLLADHTRPLKMKATSLHPENPQKEPSLSDINFSTKLMLSPGARPDVPEAMTLVVRRTKHRTPAADLPQDQRPPLFLERATTMPSFDVDDTSAPSSRTVLYSPSLMLMTGSNQAALPVGGGTGSIAVFYMIKYITKPSTSLSATLAVWHTAHKEVRETFLSVADDTGTPSRTAMHELARTINSCNRMVEYSAQQAAAFLLGDPPSRSSHRFWYLYSSPLLAMIGATTDDTAEDDGEEEHGDGNAPQVATDPVAPGAAAPPTAVLPNDLYRDLLEGALEFEDDNEVTMTLTSTGKSIVLMPPQHLLYLHRGTKLQCLSIYEWCAMFETFRRTRVLAGGTRGRLPNGAYEFSPSLGEFATTHIQRLRSKFFVPVFAGSRPPAIPTPLPLVPTASALRKYDAAWNRFARFAIATYHPWIETADHQFLPGLPLDHANLESWARELKRSANEDGDFVSASRLRFLQNHLHVLSRQDSLDLLAQFKYRAAKKWSQTEQVAYDIVRLRSANDTSAAAHSGLATAIAELLLNPFQEMDPQETKAKARAAQLMALFPRVQPPAQPSPSPLVLSSTISKNVAKATKSAIDEHTKAQASQRAEEASALLDTLQGFQASDANTNADDALQYLSRTYLKPGELSHSLDATQLHTVRTIADKLLQVLQRDVLRMSPANAEVSNMIVLGGPGTGKSFVLQNLYKYLGELKVLVRFTATSGVASTLLPHGQTVHSAFRFGTSPREDDNVTTDAMNLELQGLYLLIIDEVSMLTTKLLSCVNAALKKSRRNTPNQDRPFGGVLIVLVGDLFQLPAVGVSLVNSFNEKPDCYTRITLKNFQYIQLVAQQRARGDALHSAFLTKLRSSNAVTVQEISDHVPRLQSADLSGNFATAPLLVVTNSLRNQLILARAKYFALTNQTPLIAWRLPFVNTPPFPTDSTRDLLYSDRPYLHGYFIAGAPAVLTSNVSTALKLANGVRVSLHSLILPPESEEALAEAMTELADHRSGRTLNEPIYLPFPPKYAVVKVDRSDGVEYPQICLLEGSDATTVLFPIGPSKDERSFKICGKKQTASFLTPGYDLQFAVTYHKAQGQTLQHVILDLDKPLKMRLTREMAYVGLSRVPASTSLRRLSIVHLPNAFQWSASIPALVDWLGHTQPRPMHVPPNPSRPPGSPPGRGRGRSPTSPTGRGRGRPKSTGTKATAASVPVARRGRPSR